MKLLYEDSAPVFSVENQLNEATGTTVKKYKIKGIFSSPGVKNKNGRVYPMNIWEREVEKYQKILEQGHINCLMEYEHPPRSEVNPMEAVAKIEKFYIKDGFVMGEAVLLDNPKANQLKSLIDNGVILSVSTRGVGKVGKNGIVEDYNYITTDIVVNQSDHNAQMKGIVEGVLMTEDYEINEQGDIVKVCGKTACITENRENIDKLILEKITALLEAQKAIEVPENLKQASLADVISFLETILGDDKDATMYEIIAMLKECDKKSDKLDTSIVSDIKRKIKAKEYKEEEQENEDV